MLGARVKTPVSNDGCNWMKRGRASFAARRSFAVRKLSKSHTASKPFAPYLQQPSRNDAASRVKNAQRCRTGTLPTSPLAESHVERGRRTGSERLGLEPRRLRNFGWRCSGSIAAISAGGRGRGLV